MPIERKRRGIKYKVTNVGPQSKSVYTYHLGCSSNVAKHESTVLQNPVEHQDPENITEYPMQQISNSSTNYDQYKRKLYDSWDNIHPVLLDAFYEGEVFPRVVCSLCKDSDAVIRCVDCGPNAFYCESCCQTIHAIVILHKPKLWQQTHYIDFPNPPLYTTHACQTTYMKTVVIYDNSGRQHSSSIQCCSCETELLTMWRQKLWPSSPTNPSVGIYLPLLQRFHAYQMEGHVSLYANCISTVNASSSMTLVGELLYKILAKQAWGQYTHFQHCIKSACSILPELDDGGSCPACPSVDDTVDPLILSADANFGLVRRKAAAHCIAPPKTEGIFFLPQEVVDAKLKSVDNVEKIVDNDCNEFQAGTTIRSKVKNAKLDETGVFGSVCRHEYPQLFCSIKSGGEKLGYSVLLLETILENRGENAKVVFMYDIACLLDKHLKRVKSDILESVAFSVPIFHNYGHKMKCQLHFPKGLLVLSVQCFESFR